MQPTPPAASSHSITLEGSSSLVTEFFSYGVNTLLYQRGIYPPETFSRVSKYGLTMMLSTDQAVKQYLDAVLEQMNIWLSRRALRRVVVVLASVATKRVLERWAFDVHVNDPDYPAPTSAPVKDHKEIVREIQAVVRQITASVTFLPLLDEACSFDMLIYTTESTETPAAWEETGPRTIHNDDSVQLRSFSTSVHNVDASVSYARPVDDS